LLFVKTNGSWATKRYFINKLKQALPSEDVAGHSFRAGGDNRTGYTGVQLILVQKIGRWSLDTFYRYIQAHQATIAAILIKVYSN
ncbi:28827_t:CDS:1, partial [Racocetra persica]